MSKADAAVYMKAARKIANGDATFACVAIGSMSSGENEKQRRIFVERFCPSPDHTYRPWYELREQSPRILALCFAAAMAESGDL